MGVSFSDISKKHDEFDKVKAQEKEQKKEVAVAASVVSDTPKTPEATVSVAPKVAPSSTPSSAPASTSAPAEPTSVEPVNNPSDASYYVGKKKVIDAKGLEVYYNLGKTNEFKALNGVDMEIYAHEYVMFFGPSGCGKSTLMNTIAGLEVPTDGTVIVNGNDISKFSSDELAWYHRREIGMVFQSYNLIPSLDVLSNVCLPQVFDRVRLGVREDIGMQYLEKLGLEKVGRRLPQELSGGQQQRVSIARSLVNNPPIILTDEAVGNLDSKSAKNVLEILDRLNREDKKTIISVTHNPEHLFYADRIFYMRDGKVIKVEVNQEKIRPQDAAEASNYRGKGYGEIIKTEINKERNALDILLQSYPDLTSMQFHVMLAPFKAKIITNYLISKFEGKEIERLEKIITNRLVGKSDKEDMLKLFDAQPEEGGMGLNWSTALKFTDVIENVVKRSEYIRDEHEGIKNNEADPIMRVVKELRRGLMDEYDGKITPEQIEALDKGIEFRFTNKINREEFQEYLDRRFDRGGVGFGSATAKKFAKKMELTMLVEFGKREEDLSDKI